MSEKRTFARPPDAVLREKLSPLEFKVTQLCGTEPPFHNAYWDNHEPGLYVDAVSGEPLFTSNDKFDSGTGWPSFTRPVEDENVVEKADRAHGMRRVRRVRARARHDENRQVRPGRLLGEDAEQIDFRAGDRLFRKQQHTRTAS